MAGVFRNILYMTPGFAAGTLLFVLLLRPRRRRMRARGLESSPLRETAGGLFWMFAGGMAAITLAPGPSWLFDWIYFSLHGQAEQVFAAYGIFGGYVVPLEHRVNLIPFAQGDRLVNIVGNVVMFLPFGFFAALLWRGWNGRRAALAGLGITCCIECWQILAGRHFDVDDIILNTIGVFGGYLLWRMLERLAPRFARKFHVMDTLELVEPAMEYQEQVMAFKAEVLAQGGGFEGCAGLEDADAYEEWLDFRGREKRKGWIPSHTWLTVRRSDGRVVGMINYRPSPLPDFVLRYGGHIGYSIRPSERRKGYAKEQLRLTLEKCRAAGEERVLLTCDHQGNPGSERTILANGGVLEDEVEDTPGLGGSGRIRRYWIAIT